MTPKNCTEDEVESQFLNKHCLFWTTDVNDIPYEGTILKTKLEMEEYMYLIKFSGTQKPIWVKCESFVAIQPMELRKVK
jgi:hypothetical protein